MTGRMAEWSNAAVLKTAEPVTVPGFESLSFRHLKFKQFHFSTEVSSLSSFLAYASGLSHQGKYRID